MVLNNLLTVALIAITYPIYSYFNNEDDADNGGWTAISEQEQTAAQEFDRQNSNAANKNATEMETIIGTRELVFETLRRIGCEYREDEDNRILINYQGESFIIIASNDSLFINVYDNWWYSLSTYCEVEEFARLQKVINHANAFVNSTLLYTIHKESEQIGVHTKKSILFIPQIPEIDSYLISVLNEFFNIQRLVMTELEKHKVREEQQ